MSIFPYYLAQNMMSPATQMVFSGTDSKFNLANWNVFGGGYGSYGCYSNYGDLGYGMGSIFGLVALRAGIGVVGSVVNQVRVNNAKVKEMSGVEELPADLKKAIEGIDKEINEKLAELPGSADINSYNNVKPDEKFEQAKIDTESAYDEAKNSVAANGKLTKAVTAAETTVEELEILAELEGRSDKTTDEAVAKRIADLKAKYGTKTLTEAKSELKKAQDTKKEAEDKIKAPNGELYKAKEDAVKKLEAEKERIADIKSEITELKNTKTKYENALYNQSMKKEDGTVASRLFGDKITYNDKGEITNDANDCGKQTIQKLLYKYNTGTVNDKKAVKKWLEANYDDLKMTDGQKTLVDKIVKTEV